MKGTGTRSGLLSVIAMTVVALLAAALLAWPTREVSARATAEPGAAATPGPTPAPTPSPAPTTAPAQDGEASLDEFKPGEELPADGAVSFPSDI